MRVILDGHIHSRFSRATSHDMTLKNIEKYAIIKGLNIVGTGDFTHPLWLKEIKSDLIELESSGLYVLRGEKTPKVCFMLTTEVSTHFAFDNKVKRVHHVIWVPSINIAEQVNESLSKHGSLSSDGRPTLQMTAAELVEKVLEVSVENIIFPAHVWTPWFSVFGAFSGFDRMKDCYEEKTDEIYALETGLSSDPPMNWRVSELDRLAIVSNSDSHSYWPWRLGREANVFELENMSFPQIDKSLRSKKSGLLKLTLETNPEYGKYHWTGHRACNVAMSASDSISRNGICPVCGRKMTRGVEERVEEISDRPQGYRPEGAVSCIHILPLSEIITQTLGLESPSTGKVWSLYNLLVQKFGSEYETLINAEFKDLSEVAGPEVAKLIVDIREDRVEVTPGYDGVYGKLAVKTKKGLDEKPRRKGKLSLQDFM